MWWELGVKSTAKEKKGLCDKKDGEEGKEDGFMCG